jgi:hypothetical protein
MVGQPWRTAFSFQADADGMLAPADVHAVLRSSRFPLGTGAIALTLGIHWAPVAELLVSLERKGEVVWQDHGWMPAVPNVDRDGVAPG